MEPLPPDTLRVLILPLDQTRTLAETGDDENIVVTMIGEKSFLLSLVAAIATPKEMTAP